MKSTKCPQCGLVYWTTAPNCKRCGLPTADYEGERPVAEMQDQPSGDAPGETHCYAPQSTATIGDEVREEQLLRNLKRDARLFYFIGGLQALAWFVMIKLFQLSTVTWFAFVVVSGLPLPSVNPGAKGDAEPN